MIDGARPLRVAHVTATFPPYLGGAGTVAFEQATRLAERGHHVEVFTAATPGSPPPSAAIVHRDRPPFAIGNAPLLPALLRVDGFDVVHLHYPFIFGTEALLTGRARRTPLVVSFHNRLIGAGLVRRPLFAGYEATWGRAMARRADRLCVVSRAHAATVPYLERARSRDPARVVEVPNGVDVERFTPGPDRAGVRARFGIPAGAPLVVFVGALDRAHYLKRPDLALRTLAHAHVRQLDAHLLVVGGGEELDLRRREAAALGIADRVHFAGAIGHDTLPDYLRAGDVLLSTSDLESFGIVLIEAMACGVPVVSTDLPGTRAVVRHGETGLLVPGGDVGAIADGVRRLLDGDPVRMGAAGRSVVERRFSWPHVVDRVEAVYRDVARSSGSLA